MVRNKLIAVLIGIAWCTTTPEDIVTKRATLDLSCPSRAPAA
jgi:hypothetical protein